MLACFTALAWYLMADPEGQASGERLNAALSHLAGTSTAPEGSPDGSASDTGTADSGSHVDMVDPSTSRQLLHNTRPKGAD